MSAFLFRSLFRLAAFALPFVLPPVVSAMEPVNLLPFFPGEPEAMAELHLRASKLAEVTDYKILNYGGEMVSSGSLSTNDDGMFAVPASLASGYYEVALGDSEKADDVFPFIRLPALSVGNPGEQERGNPYFFSIDAAASWLMRPEVRAERIAQLPRLIRGGLVRERLSWNAIHPSRETRNWETERQYETIRRLYADNGLKVLEMFHDSPAWLGKAQNGKFPRDLPGAARSFADIARRWKNYWGAIEVWNEPDIGYGAWQPADQYVPIVKTIRHTLREAGIEVPVIGGAFAYMNPDFMQQAAANGLLDEIDAISFHTYSDALQLEKRMTEIRAWLASAGHESKPVWITEMGRRWRGKNTKPSLIQQQETARIIAMQAVEARACGVAAWFPFVYPAYNEHENNFGLTDSRGLPMRALAAVAQISRVLADTVYVGDLNSEDHGAAKRIRVFAIGETGQALVVVYTDDAPSTTNITLPFPASSAQGIDGRALKIKVAAASTIVPVPDGIAYVMAQYSTVAPLLRADTEAMRLTRIAGQVTAALPEPTPIVLQPLIDLKKTGIRAVTRGYHLPAGDVRAVPVFLRINNLSDASHSVSVSYELKSGGSSLSQDVTVEGGGWKQVTFQVDPSVLPSTADGMFLLSFSASSSSARRIAPASVTFIPALGLEAHLERHGYQFSLPIGDQQRWQKNSNGTMSFGYESSGAKWGFHAKFKGGDRWAYPRLSLPQEVQVDRVTGVLIRARCSRPAIVRLMSWDENNANSVTTSPLFPTDGQWSVVYVPLSSWLKPGNDESEPLGRQLKDISLGFNSQVDENAIEVSDFYLLGN